MKRIGSALWLTSLALGLFCNAQAAEAPSTTNEITIAGVKVGIDAETGQLRPLTPAESSALDQALTQGRATASARTLSAAPTVRRHADGGVSAKVPESQMTSVVAKRDASGQLVIQHADADGIVDDSEGLPNE